MLFPQVPAARETTKKRVRAACCAAAALLSLSPRAHAWTDRDYAAHDHRSFAALPAARARIDMKKIDHPLLNAALFYETNRERAAHGKSALRHSPALERTAQGHSMDMVRYDFLSHESPVKGKTALDDRLSREGLAPRRGTRGENIGDIFGIEYESGAKIYPPDGDTPYFRYPADGEALRDRTYLGLAREAVRQWMGSPGHRRNILDGEFRELGTGSAHYNDPGFFHIDMFKVTQVFFGGKLSGERQP